MCTRTFLGSVAVCIMVDVAKELRSSGNCERFFMRCASQNSYKRVRYSNTLLVSLNNRIYFREHRLPEHGYSAFLAVSDRVRALAVSSLSFAVPESQTQAPKGAILPLDPISQPGTFDHNTGNVTSTESVTSSMCKLTAV